MNPRFIILCSALVLLTSAFLDVVQANPWPQWRGPNRDGITSESIATWPESGPEKSWEKELGYGVSSVAVVDGKLYTMGNKNDEDIVYCLNAQTGEEIWTFKYRQPFDKRMFDGGTSTTPTVDKDLVFTLSEQGDLYALNSDTGTKVWSRNLQTDFVGVRPRWGYSGSPLVINDMVIVEPGGDGTSAVALHRSTGEIVWKAGSDEVGYAAPVLYDFRGLQSILFFNAYGVVCRERSNGKELWRHRWKTNWNVNAVTPLFKGNEIFVSSGYGSGSILLDVGSGKPEVVYADKKYANQFSTSVLIDGYLYGFHGNHVGKRRQLALACVEWKTGEVAWKEKGLGMGTLIAADGKLVILSEGGELILAEANSSEFKEIRRNQVLGGRNWVHPILSEGQLYCRNNQGKLVVFNVTP